jgi:hypothetical protein
MRLHRRVGLGERTGTFAKLLQGFRVGVSTDEAVEFSFDASAAAATGASTAPASRSSSTRCSSSNGQSSKR